jgi:hypothetical protein
VEEGVVGGREGGSGRVGSLAVAATIRRSYLEKKNSRVAGGGDRWACEKASVGNR